MLAAIAAVLLQQDPPFVPALQHGSRTVAQWIEELRHGARPLDAIWSLYYADDHSAEVVAALKDALADSRAPECRVAADTILCHWRVEHALVPAEAYASGATLEQFAAKLGPPVESRASDKEALRRLVDSEADSIWGSEHAGSAWFDALGEQLAQAKSLHELLDPRPDWSAALAKRAPGCTAAIPWLAQIGARGGADAQLAHKLLAPLTDWLFEDETPADPYWMLNLRAGQRKGEEDPFVEEYALARARLALEEPRTTRDAILRLHRAALDFPHVAELCAQRLPERLEGAGELALDILCLLTHIESKDPRLRAAYLRTLRTVERFDDESLERIPLWKHHDDETRAAFLDLLGKTPEPGALFEQLCFAGELDATTSPLARTFIERTEGNYHWMVSRGFRGTVEVAKDGPRVRQINQLALNIAAKQGRGLDFAAEEHSMAAILALPYDQDGAEGYNDQVEWGFFHAQTLGLRSHELVHAALHYVELGDFPKGFGSHFDAATAYLESIPLEIQDHLALRKLRGPDESEPEWKGITLVNRQFGGEPVSKLSLQDVPRWRQRIFSDAPEFLAKLLRVTPLTEREQPYLLALLERGTTEQRLWTLWLLEEYHVDTPGVRAAVEQVAARDLDASVRRKAHALSQALDAHR